MNRLLLKRQQQECPVCFNCHAPTDTCVNGGLCDASGACECPAGWGGLDCAEPKCGSLYSDNRPLRQPGHDCACDSGWSGVNCNVCQTDSVCTSVKGRNATCIKSAIGLKSMHAWCDTTNIPWIDNTHVSLSCEWEHDSCVFQFWKDSEEQFYCELSECSQTTSGDSDVHGRCEKAKCGCMKGAFMCGKEVDMSELVKNVKGPSEWYCKDGKDCWYNEYSTLVSVFPDNIQLACDVGECANEQDFLDAVPIERTFSKYTEITIISAIALACMLLFCITKYTARRQQKMFGERIELNEEEDDDDLVSYTTTTEAALTFNEVSYSVKGKPILQNISGFVEPGQLLAIMGPSGAACDLSDIMSICDILTMTMSGLFCIFNGGELAYFGPANTCSDYFRNLGFTIPADYNVADYLIDLTMKKPDLVITRPSTPLPPSSSNEQLEPLQEIHAFHTAESSGELNLVSESNHLHHLLQSFQSSQLCKTIQERVGRSSQSSAGTYSVWVDTPGLETSPLSIPQFYHELSLLSSRTFINLYRNPFLFFAHFAFSIVLAVLLGTLFWQVDVDLSGVQNRLGVLFFMCALLGFAATSALDMFNKERILFMRERENGYYSPGSYFTAKILFDIVPLRILPPLVMGAISYYMIGLNHHLLTFGKFLLVLVLFNLSAAGLCLCFATAFKNLSAANLLANLVILFSMLFGGWLQYLSFFNYGYEALIVNELKDLTLRDKSIADIQIPGPIILARFGFNGQAFWRDVGWLSVFVVVTLTTSFVFLKYLVKEKR
ncbi:hypothetical protein K501DRAFT_286647 [Backusella circina FSU 941]|nr:hypothetical protein K501DRAFT_286647 [Backusella circina FSU 941]